MGDDSFLPFIDPVKRFSLKERCLLTGTYCFFLLSCACEKGSFFPVGFQTGSRKLRKKNPESGNQSYERNPKDKEQFNGRTAGLFFSFKRFVIYKLFLFHR